MPHGEAGPFPMYQKSFALIIIVATAVTIILDIIAIISTILITPLPLIPVAEDKDNESNKHST